MKHLFFALSEAVEANATAAFMDFSYFLRMKMPKWNCQSLGIKKMTPIA